MRVGSADTGMYAFMLGILQRLAATRMSSFPLARRQCTYGGGHVTAFGYFNNNRIQIAGTPYGEAGDVDTHPSALATDFQQKY